MGLDALLKGTSAMDEGAGNGGILTGNLLIKGQRSNHWAMAAHRLNVQKETYLLSFVFIVGMKSFTPRGEFNSIF